MLKTILIVLAIALVAFVIVVATRPADFRITRSATVAAPPAIVFEQVNTLRNWDAWSPWAKLDPNTTQTFEGPPSGAGSSFSWAGNNKVGAGKMTILESKPNELVRFQLDFVKPFKATNDSEWTFQPEGGQTRVTWTMTGKNNFPAKAFSMFVDCDKMVGGDFEKGLAQLNTVSQSAAPKQ
jgi:uncharacterized protein YndB with AHSA1/START domain